MQVFFKKTGLNPVSFCLFSFFSHDKYSTNTVNEKSVDGVLGTQTRGGRMVGADESTELWRHPNALCKLTERYWLQQRALLSSKNVTVKSEYSYICKRTYHCTADLLFHLFGFDQKGKFVVVLLYLGKQCRQIQTS